MAVVRCDWLMSELVDGIVEKDESNGRCTYLNAPAVHPNHTWEPAKPEGASNKQQESGSGSGSASA